VPPFSQYGVPRTGRRPTRKAKDQAEKSLGIWLHRFTCNDDGVRTRAQASLDADEFQQLIQTIIEAPDSKQMSDRQVALSNIEAIAERAAVLNALPLRNDPSGCGRKLHNIRQGRLPPNMKEAALAIVHCVLGTAPEKASVLACLETCIEHSVQRHIEVAQRTALSRINNKRPAPDADADADDVEPYEAPYAASVGEMDATSLVLAGHNGVLAPPPAPPPG